MHHHDLQLQQLKTPKTQKPSRFEIPNTPNLQLLGSQVPSIVAQHQNIQNPKTIKTPKNFNTFNIPNIYDPTCKHPKHNTPCLEMKTTNM
jgi:hypothetical protein